MDRAGKKTAVAIYREIAREVKQLLSRTFSERQNNGQTDLRARENALRTALHQADAAALSQRLQFEVPAPDQPLLPCPCGPDAHCRQLHSRARIDGGGRGASIASLYLCPDSLQGQLPADVELGIETTNISPGVRRMQALMDKDAPFDHDREQIKVLAGLEGNTKSVERTAEAG